MKVYCSPYSLTPLKKANRLSSLKKSSGVLLKGVLGNKITFADYYPHTVLGDKDCDEFLQNFKFQNNEYEQKVFELLLKDDLYQNLKNKKFYNHALWTEEGTLNSKVIKYKLQGHHDRGFMKVLETGLRLRLDANGLFSKTEYQDFLKDIPVKFHTLIDYIEDPLSSEDWKDLKIPTGRDFVSGDPYDYYIYKPNCEHLPKTEAKIIYSSYLGSDFGRWHAYCELITKGDLSLVHGIVTPHFFQEQEDFFIGNFDEGFDVSVPSVRKLYQNISSLNWKSLCSM